MLKVMLKTQQVSKNSSPYQDNGDGEIDNDDKKNNQQNSKVDSSSGSSSSSSSRTITTSSNSGVHRLAHSTSDLIDQLPNTVSVCFYNIKSYELIALLSDKVR